MNFLAHAVLAGSSAERIVGSMAGDFVKGVLYEANFQPEFLLGLRLHRRIDAFSNQQPILRKSAKRLPAHLQRLAAPCIDMMADHFLACHAQTNPGAYLPAIEGQLKSNLSLVNYEKALHQILGQHKTMLGEDAVRFFSHAKATHLFSDYQNFKRIERSILYLCKRLGQNERGEEMINALAEQFEGLSEDFLNYWPSLKAEANRFLKP